ncbi:hypothetical protein CHS0354_003296 [Potamilus streckersoni]|uniref:Uncharacterized protein n=1 Tax=Potamilus streckersoni TaxID=2493646 RepID=A0AAE0S734_9BIVA|nr:hypothetical protein CHS0354_003296 [Potamilus streckersoni]
MAIQKGSPYKHEVNNASTLHRRGTALKYKYVQSNGVISATYTSRAAIEVAATLYVSDYAHEVAATTIARVTKHMPPSIFQTLATNAKVGVFIKAETLTVYSEYAGLASPPGCECNAMNRSYPVILGDALNQTDHIILGDALNQTDHIILGDALNQTDHIILGDALNQTDHIILGDALNQTDHIILGDALNQTDHIILGDALNQTDHIILGDALNQTDHIILGDALNQTDHIILGDALNMSDYIILGDALNMSDYIILGNAMNQSDHIIVGKAMNWSDYIIVGKAMNWSDYIIVGKAMNWSDYTILAYSPYTSVNGAVLIKVFAQASVKLILSCTFDGRKYSTLAGTGGIRTVVVDDNVLCNSNDPYNHQSNILVHEFSHTIHTYGLSGTLKSRVGLR